MVEGGIFSIYVGFLIWNIFYSFPKDREENYSGYYQRHQAEKDKLK